jgi:hypothetical protein
VLGGINKGCTRIKGGIIMLVDNWMHGFGCYAGFQGSYQLLASFCLTNSTKHVVTTFAAHD